MNEDTMKLLFLNFWILSWKPAKSKQRFPYAFLITKHLRNIFKWRKANTYCANIRNLFITKVHSRSNRCNIEKIFTNISGLMAQYMSSRKMHNSDIYICQKFVTIIMVKTQTWLELQPCILTKQNVCNSQNKLQIYPVKIVRKNSYID